ncbi:YcxB family protein [Psychromonas sp.]|uniref:YcxB family protein n=1 Tax=Psychromonas sp. TaxID=1884585 RepID=UPI003564CAF7
MFFQSKFVLNREHFEECFDQSALLGKKAAPRYKFMAFLVIGGCLILILVPQQKTLAFFLIALSFVEYFSFRYRRAWWLMRQMWSRNSHNTITLTINDQGVKTESLYNNSELLWAEIKGMVETPKGIMLLLKNGNKNYLSKASLDEKAVAYIKLKAAPAESECAC